GRGGAAGGLGDAERVGEVMEPATVLRERDRVRARARDLATDPGESVCEVERGLPAELCEHRDRRSFVLEDRGDGLLVERVKIKPGGRVEVGGDGLRVAVH